MTTKCYKVLTFDGKSPFVCEEYNWSLPTEAEPGKWHEELNPKPGLGLHVTFCPTRWMSNPETDVAYEAEAEGLVVDKMDLHAARAKRVRLVRKLTKQEIKLVSEKWNHEN